MKPSRTTRCLILACGNPLRGDDGVGPWLGSWAEERFRGHAGVHVISRQQWTPELAQEIAAAESVLFLDASADTAPGSVQIGLVKPAAPHLASATHHLGAAELLDLTQSLYGLLPLTAQLLTVGIGTAEIGERLSKPVETALPAACIVIEKVVCRTT